MKYSLRSLMVAITLIALLVGSRMEYLRRRAAFHARRADEHLRSLQASKHLSNEEAERFLEFHGVWQKHFEGQLGSDYRAAYYHRTLAEAYQKTLSSPWKSVNERPAGWEDMSP